MDSRSLRPQAVVMNDGPQQRLVTDERDGVQVRVLGQRQLDGGDDLARAQVAAHRVHRDPTG